MADTVEFELVTPARLVLTESVEMVVVPGGEGDFGVLPGHAPLISTVRPGVLDVHGGGKVTEQIFVSGGFAEVGDDRCTVLAEEALPLAEVNRADAESRLGDARARLEATDSTAGTARANAEHAVEAAQALLDAVDRRDRKI